MSITRNNTNTTNNVCSSTSFSNKSTSTATVIAPNNSGTKTNYDIYTDTKGTLPKKPPAYDYFKEPTVYAQIDHFKTMQHKNSNSHASAQQPSHITTMPNSASASNAYQMHHHSTNLVPSASNAANQSNPYYQQQPNQSELQYGSGTALNHNNINGTLSNSNTLTFSSIQSPLQPPQSLSTTSKQYSREIVTIRTPLLCSQQESCV